MIGWVIVVTACLVLPFNPGPTDYYGFSHEGCEKARQSYVFKDKTSCQKRRRLLTRLAKVINMGGTPEVPAFQVKYMQPNCVRWNGKKTVGDPRSLAGPMGSIKKAVSYHPSFIQQFPVTYRWIDKHRAKPKPTPAKTKKIFKTKTELDV